MTPDELLATLAKATIVAPEASDIGDYEDFDGTGIVVLDDDRRVAAFHRQDDAAAYVAAVNYLRSPDYRALVEAAASAERMREALKPFAREARGWDADVNGGHNYPDNETPEDTGKLRVGHFRAAREALAGAA